MNFYNEIDPYCCDWLENLIQAKLIPDGVVDRRSIVDILPAELTKFTQCHFFAGLGGWPLALRLAAYPDHRPVWTGSCPCQPFSAAGKRLGFADDRHLWPWWRYLIAVCRPAGIVGEQVASASAWLALVRGDLEALEYAVGCMPVEAASAGADHLRDRFWFAADAAGERRNGSEFTGTTSAPAAGSAEAQERRPAGILELARHGSGSNGVALGDARIAGLAQRECDGGIQREALGAFARQDPTDAGHPFELPGMEYAARFGRSEGQSEPELWSGRDAAAEPGFPFDMADRNGERQSVRTQQHEWTERSGQQASFGNDAERSGFCTTFDLGNSDVARARADSPEGSSWGAISEPGGRGYEWVLGADGKARRVESGICLLTHALSGRVAVRRTVLRAGAEVEEEHWYSRVRALKALGNAIDPRPAAAFIKAALTY